MAECITFDPDGVNGVGWGRLLQQASQTLKLGGTIIIKSAHFENEPDKSVPDRNWYAQTMAKHGFNSIVEMDQFYSYTVDNQERKNQRVWYYGIKAAEGFDLSRSPENTLNV